MLISNITPNVKVNEFYKHKDTKNTKLCLPFFIFSLCASCLRVYYFSLGVILLISINIYWCILYQRLFELLSFLSKELIWLKKSRQGLSLGRKKHHNIPAFRQKCDQYAVVKVAFLTECRYHPDIFFYREIFPDGNGRYVLILIINSNSLLDSSLHS